MTRREIVDTLAKEINMPKKYIDNIIVLFLDVIKSGLFSSETIFLRGFGTFGLKKRNETLRRNPKTNEKINVPSHYVVYFKAGKDLKKIKKKFMKNMTPENKETEAIIN